MRGTESEQTKKIRMQFEHLKAAFSHTTWTLWDERLSSKRAAALGTRTKKNKEKNKQAKRQEHAVAAAFILDSYLNAQ
jgi:RNase H-fold protein (predicted Holliday junction resolvase)